MPRAAKGHNYLRCTKRVNRDCSQPFAREESVTEQIAAAIDSVLLSADDAAWMLSELDREEHGEQPSFTASIDRVQETVDAIDLKLDRLAAAYLDAGAFSPIEYRSRKEALIDEKRKLDHELSVFVAAKEARFEPLRRFVNGSAELRSVTERRNPEELRAAFKRVGSNHRLRDRTIRWEPRGAWQLVVAKRSLAQHNTAPLDSGAVLCGESRFSPLQCG